MKQIILFLFLLNPINFVNAMDINCVEKDKTQLANYFHKMKTYFNDNGNIDSFFEKIPAKNTMNLVYEGLFTKVTNLKLYCEGNISTIKYATEEYYVEIEVNRKSILNIKKYKAFTSLTKDY